MSATGELPSVAELERLWPVDQLVNRILPGFVAEYGGRVGSVPLRAVTRIDGFGQLGVALYVSGHQGLAAAQHTLSLIFGEDEQFDDAYMELGPKSAAWGIAKIPLRSLRRHLGACVVSIHPMKGAAAAKGMVAAGLAKWRLDLEPEECGGDAPMLELLAMSTCWTKVASRQDE